MAGRVSIRLDSTGEALGWTVQPSASSLVVRATGRGAALLENGRTLRQWDASLDALEWLTKPDSAPAAGRWVGFLGYDLGRKFENLPETAHDDLHLPDWAFAFVADGDEGDSLTSRQLESSQSPRRLASAALPPQSTFTKAAYLRAIWRTIEYIKAGDVFQVNLSQRFSFPQPASAEAVYERLRQHSPARYGGLLDFGDFALACNSPELFLHVTPDRRVCTRPIKGTRPRGEGMERALRDSAKDQAELNMIVDLERNDLGRVCEVGSVSVTEPREIESHPTVYHGVATIEGVLRKEIGLVELLRATFPGGSVTGAPKIRAMQIIEELEPVRRGPYCGAIGYVATDGSMQFNVAIRTMIFANSQVHVPVGGGIVADSAPEEEYQETLVKARAMFAALGVDRASIE